MDKLIEFGIVLVKILLITILYYSLSHMAENKAVGTVLAFIAIVYAFWYKPKPPVNIYVTAAKDE